MGNITEQMIVDKIKNLIDHGIEWTTKVEKHGKRSVEGYNGYTNVDDHKTTFTIDEIVLSSLESDPIIKAYVKGFYAGSFKISPWSKLCEYLDYISKEKAKNREKEAIDYLKKR